MNLIQELRANPLVTHFASSDQDGFRKKAAIIASIVVLVSGVGIYLINISPKTFTIDFRPPFVFHGWADIAFSLPAVIFFMVYPFYLAAASASWAARMVGNEEFQTIRLTQVTPRQITVGFTCGALYKNRLLIVLALSLLSLDIFKPLGSYIRISSPYFFYLHTYILSAIIGTCMGILKIVSCTICAVSTGIFSAFALRSSALTIGLAIGAMFILNTVQSLIASVYGQIVYTGVSPSGGTPDSGDVIWETIESFVPFYSPILIAVLVYVGLTLFIIQLAEMYAKRL